MRRVWCFVPQVVFATVVTRGPRSAMAPQALTQLDQAYELFTQASKHSRRAAKALVSAFLLRRREGEIFRQRCFSLARPMIAC